MTLTSFLADTDPDSSNPKPAKDTTWIIHHREWVWNEQGQIFLKIERKWVLRDLPRLMTSEFRVSSWCHGRCGIYSNCTDEVFARWKCQQKVSDCESVQPSSEMIIQNAPTDGVCFCLFFCKFRQKIYLWSKVWASKCSNWFFTLTNLFRVPETQVRDSAGRVPQNLFLIPAVSISYRK